MLTLKNAIQLNSLSNPLRLTDAFDQKLIGNYELMQAQFTPKDLLFLLVNPPELPENLGEMTTFAVQNQVNNRSEVTLEVVNHVLNRILLSNTQDFTYQDQVYIQTVLEKLGITDVSAFMKQVQLLFDENLSITQLTALYQDNVSLLRSILQQTQTPQTASEGQPEQESGAADGAAYYLHQEIFRRLQTSAIYQEVAEAYHSRSDVTQMLNAQEIRLAEQNRLSQFLYFTELKNQLRQGDGVTLTYLQNQYETGALLPDPQNEEQVLVQLAEAALFDAVSRVMVVAMQRKLDSRSFYLNLRQSLSQVAENTLARYEMYHSQYQYAGGDTTVLAESRNTLYHEEIRLIDQLLTQQSQELMVGTTIRHSDMIAARQTLELTHRIAQDLPHDDETTEETTSPPPEKITRTSEELNEILTRRLEQTTAPSPTRRQVMPSLEQVVRTYEAERHTAEETRRQERERLTEALHQVIRAERELSTSARQVTLHAVQNVRNILQNDQISGQARAAVTKLLWPQIELAAPVQKTEDLPEPLEGPVYHTSVSEQETKETVYESRPEVLRERLDQINEHNRVMAERLHEIMTETAAKTPAPKVDGSRAMDIVLRALEKPEEVLEQVMMQESPPELTHTALPPVVEALLQQADGPTRQLYEAVLLGKTPEQAEGQAPVLRVDQNVGAFNAAMLAAERQISLPEPEMRERQTVMEHLVRETAQEVSQHVLEGQSRVLQQPSTVSRMPLSLVYKQEQAYVTEALLDELNTRRETRRQETVTQEQSFDHRVQTAEVHQINQRTVERTTEDVTELINRTLAKQLGSISDKVYSQMEKRLRMERARRGY